MPTEIQIAIAAYLGVAAVFAVGVHLYADDEELDSPSLMFVTALLLLVWPVTIPFALWKMR